MKAFPPVNSSSCVYKNTIQYNTIQYNTIQYKKYNTDMCRGRDTDGRNMNVLDDNIQP